MNLRIISAILWPCITHWVTYHGRILDHKYFVQYFVPYFPLNWYTHLPCIAYILLQRTIQIKIDSLIRRNRLSAFKSIMDQPCRLKCHRLSKFIFCLLIWDPGLSSCVNIPYMTSRVLVKYKQIISLHRTIRWWSVSNWNVAYKEKKCLHAQSRRSPTYQFSISARNLMSTVDFAPKYPWLQRILVSGNR